MSASPIWTVHCGADPRSDACRWWIGEEFTRPEAEKMARAAGWLVGRTRRDVNVCPMCRRL